MARNAEIQEVQRLYCPDCGTETLFNEPRNFGQSVKCCGCQSTFRVAKIWRECDYKPRSKSNKSKC